MKIVRNTLACLAGFLLITACGGNQPKNELKPATLEEVKTALTTIEEDFNAQAQALYEDTTLTMEQKQEKIEAVYETVITDYIETGKKYVRESPLNDAGAYAFSQICEMLDDAEFEELAALLADSLKTKEPLAAIFEQRAKVEATSVGKMFVDFEAENLDGTVGRLSDYVGKGKYILVDFWASWCGPCRREIPNIKDVYAQYHGEQFDILSVAVWDKLEDTKQALDEEQLPWNQLLNAGQVPTDIYGIEGIPHIILFGPDGKIVARGIRGEGIGEAVAEALGL